MRALRGVYTALAEDARQEAMSPAAEWLLDNFHIVSAAARDIQHDLPPSFFRRLPRVAADEFAGLPRIYALALELIRIERRPARRAAAAAIHQRLPVGHAADDRRAVGVAERAQAGADRAPARARRRARRRSRAHRLAADRAGRARSRRRRAATDQWPDAGPSRVRHAAAAALARATATPASRAAATSSTTALAARGETIEDAIRAEGQHQAAEQAAMANLIGSLRLIVDVRLERVLRERQPGRAGAAARSGRRLRPDGLPQPRPLSPRGRGAGRADRRGAAALALKSVERARQVARADAGRAGGARRLSPDRRRPAAVRAQRRLAAATCGSGSGACFFALRHARSTSARSRPAPRCSSAVAVVYAARARLARRRRSLLVALLDARAGQRAGDSDRAAPDQLPDSAAPAAAARARRGARRRRGRW